MVDSRLGGLVSRVKASSLVQGVAARSTARPVRGWLVTDEEHAVDIRMDAGSLRIRSSDVAGLLGWRAEARGLCREAECVPWPAGPPEDLQFIDVGLLSETLGLPVATASTAEGPVAVIGRRVRDWPLRSSLRAPDVELVDLDGQPRRLGEWNGRRRVLLAFASWCGCRDDLPVWQGVLDRIDPDDALAFVAIAVDEEAADVRDLTTGCRFPILLDKDRRFCEAYGIIHVPTVLWIDESDEIVRPNDLVFADDRLKEHHGLDSTRHHDQLRDWVDRDEPPVARADLASLTMAPTAEEQRARVEFRLGLWLLRRGYTEAAAVRIAEAGRLAPEDFTIRRAGIQLLGGDPFGEEFARVYAHWLSVSGGEYYRDRGS